MFYYYYYISKDAINIIRSAFGESGSYGSKIQGKCPVQDSYTRIIRSKRSNVTPIQVLVIKIDKNYITKEIPSILFLGYWLGGLLIFSQ